VCVGGCAQVCTNKESAGVGIRWFPVEGFDTHLIPRSFSCEHVCITFLTCLCSYLRVYTHAYIYICIYIYAYIHK